MRIDPETRTYIHVVKGRVSEFARALYSGHAWFKRSRVVTRVSFPKLTERELTPLKGRAERKKLLNPNPNCRLRLHGGAEGERRCERAA